MFNQYLTDNSVTAFTKCLLFVTINKLKKSMAGPFQYFLFHLVVSYSVCFLLKFEATSHNTMFVGVVVFFLPGETQFTYCLNE